MLNKNLFLNPVRSGSINQNPVAEPWMSGFLDTLTGKVPVVKTELSFKDRMGGFKVRWGLNRMGYRVKPGLYAIGKPDEKSPVLVSANYKLTFDALRKELTGLDCWLLILDTRGVNVWCAAGKGTFGTKELIKRIGDTALKSVVKHREIILPQLGAVGVEAHRVASATGFRVIYGPVYARDIRAYLENGKKKNDEMKYMRFSFKDRLVLLPMELVGAKKIYAVLLIFGLIVALLKYKTVDWRIIMEVMPPLTGMMAGMVAGPLLLPVLPFRSFALSGYLLGALFTVIWCFSTYFTWLQKAAWFLISPPLSSYALLNFTGATTFTSLSGVKKEIRVALPLLIGSLICGIVLYALSLFV